MTTLGQLSKSGVIEFSDGYRTKGSEQSESGFRILRAGDLHSGRAHFDGPDFVDGGFAGAIGAKTVRRGDVALTTKGSVGRVALVGDVPTPAVYSPQICFFRIAQPETLHPRFLLYWFQSMQFQQQASYLMAATDMAPYLSLRDIGAMTITLPDLRTQRAIAEVLGSLDDKIAANERVVEVSEDLLRTRFLAACEEADQASPVGSVVDFNPPRTMPFEAEPVYVEMKDLGTHTSLIKTWSRRAPSGGVRFQHGDTVIGRITPCLENGKIGFVDFLPEGDVGIGSTEFVTMSMRNDLPTPLSFLIAEHPTFRAEAIQLMVGTSGRQRAGAKDMAQIELPLPDSATLRSLGQMAEAIFAFLARLRDENRALAATRDALLPALMRGERSVTSPAVVNTDCTK